MESSDKVCYDDLTDKYNLGEIIHTEQRNN